ncbi:MAG: hypothetical protein ACT4OK_14375 [Gemmobacter sp.]
MYPDPLGNLPRHVETPTTSGAGPSTLLTVIGFLWAAVFFAGFWVFDALEGITQRNTSAWMAKMWGLFGPQVILGITVMMSGRYNPWPLRAVFIVATLGTGTLGVAASTGMSSERALVPLIVTSTGIALIPQLFSWWLRPRQPPGRKEGIDA